MIRRFLSELKQDRRVIEERIIEEKESLYKFERLKNLDKLVIFLVVGEDRRFFKHSGFDIIAICRAIRNRIFYNKKEGASTIEQQLVRVLTNQYDKTIRRKLKEIILASTLKKYLSKKNIALLYLSLAYYGTEKQGLEQTLKSFNLKLDEEIRNDVCAGIISRLKYPEPKSHLSSKIELIEKRKIHILKLYKNGEYN